METMSHPEFVPLPLNSESSFDLLKRRTRPVWKAEQLNSWLWRRCLWCPWAGAADVLDPGRWPWGCPAEEISAPSATSSAGAALGQWRDTGGNSENLGPLDSFGKKMEEKTHGLCSICFLR